MTRMIPPLIHPKARGAERRAFGVIRDAPNSQDWVCLHSLSLTKSGRRSRPEIDFLLLTPRGAFVLEIKGGQIQREGAAWLSIDRWGDPVKRHRQPVELAAAAAIKLERDVKARFGAQHRLAQALFGFGTVLPESIFNDWGPSGDRTIVYDARDVAAKLAFDVFVDRMTRFCEEQDPRPRAPMTPAMTADLIAMLRDEFDVVPPLGVQLDDDGQGLVPLSEEQYVALDAADAADAPRVVVSGAAGTGKTLLAVECAVRESRRTQGRTLFLSYNRPVAAYLDGVVRRRIADAKFDSWSVYSFFRNLLEKAGTWNEFLVKRQGKSEESVYGRLFPEMAVEAVAKSKFRPYDTLILDEAQDYLRNATLEVFNALLKDGLDGGRWRAFRDPNGQASLYGAHETSAFERLANHARSVELAGNWRSTRCLSQEIALMASPKSLPPTLGDEGVAVEYVWYERPADQPRKLTRLLSRLWEEGTPGRTTVLSPKSATQSCVTAVQGVTMTPLTENNVFELATGQLKAITYSTLSLFKGLENDDIVLTDVENLTNNHWRSILYVALSRARKRAFVLAPTSLRADWERITGRE